MARILSTFLRSLIKSKTLNPIDMYIELQAFCIKFMDVQEAASLFKMLKGIDPENYNSDKWLQLGMSYWKLYFYVSLSEAFYLVKRCILCNFVHYFRNFRNTQKRKKIKIANLAKFKF